MTWDAYHRRKNVLREMLAIADRQRDITLADLRATVDNAREAFPTETDLLFELQMTWFQRLSGHLDRLVAAGGSSPAIVPVTAWVSAAADLPGARALLDAHRDEPALRTAIAKEQSYLASASGVAAYGSQLRVLGQRIQDTARQNLAELPAVEIGHGRQGLLARLRSVIAA